MCYCLITANTAMFVNQSIEYQEKSESVHYHHRRIKNVQDTLSSHFKHNAIKNKVYPNLKVPTVPLNTFTVIGNRVTKEFIYCSRLIRGLAKYRSKVFGTPVIEGVTGVQWPEIARKFHHKYKHVVVFMNGQLIGGVEELKEVIAPVYSYHLALDYQKESVLEFANFIKASGRACAYLQISIDDEPIGTLIFMLYSDVCPNTCANFLRLCKLKKGGYSGSPVHRIVKGGWIQCGGFDLTDVPLACENFIMQHDRRGVLGMANAGRHIDGSTQFYVLLEPQEWMKYRFVAFGQLIDGEETLRKIENVQTFQESPQSKIIIFKAGVLNLNCHTININKNAHSYLHRHVEDLITTGEMLFEMLLQNVFNKIAKKYSEFLRKESLHATKRFVHKKKQTENTPDDSLLSQISGTTGDTAKVENDEFETEDYCDPEEFPKQQTPSLSMTEKAQKLIYVPLTDILYPGEKDSHFDLRRLIQGDYCLEADLDPMLTKNKEIKQYDTLNILLKQTSRMLNSYVHFDDEEETMLAPDFEEEEVQEYLKKYADIASFGGTVVHSIAKRFQVHNPLEDRDENEVFTDEDLRKIRLTRQDLKKIAKESVLITESPWGVHSKIKRRQTGFVLPGEILKLSMIRIQDFDEDDENDQVETEEEQSAEDMYAWKNSREETLTRIVFKSSLSKLDNENVSNNKRTVESLDEEQSKNGTNYFGNYSERRNGDAEEIDDLANNRDENDSLSAPHSKFKWQPRFLVSELGAHTHTLKDHKLESEMKNKILAPELTSDLENNRRESRKSIIKSSSVNKFLNVQFSKDATILDQSLPIPASTLKRDKYRPKLSVAQYKTKYQQAPTAELQRLRDESARYAQIISKLTRFRQRVSERSDETK